MSRDAEEDWSCARFNDPTDHIDQLSGAFFRGARFKRCACPSRWAWSKLGLSRAGERAPATNDLFLNHCMPFASAPATTAGSCVQGCSMWRVVRLAASSALGCTVRLAHLSFIFSDFFHDFFRPKPHRHLCLRTLRARAHADRSLHFSTHGASLLRRDSRLARECLLVSPPGFRTSARYDHPEASSPHRTPTHNPHAVNASPAVIRLHTLAPPPSNNLRAYAFYSDPHTLTPFADTIPTHTSAPSHPHQTPPHPPVPNPFPSPRPVIRRRCRCPDAPWPVAARSTSSSAPCSAGRQPSF